MNSIILNNNQATEDIFTHIILPYFYYQDIQSFSTVNQTVEEYSYETHIANTCMFVDAYYLKIHKKCDKVTINIPETIDKYYQLFFDSYIENLLYLNIINKNEQKDLTLNLECIPNIIGLFINGSSIRIINWKKLNINIHKLVLKNYNEETMISNLENKKNLETLKIFSKIKCEIKLPQNVIKLIIKNIDVDETQEFPLLDSLELWTSYINLKKSLKLNQLYFNNVNNIFIPTSVKYLSMVNVKNIHSICNNVERLLLVNCQNIVDDTFKLWPNTQHLYLKDCPTLTYKCYKNLKKLRVLAIKNCLQLKYVSKYLKNLDTFISDENNTECPNDKTIHINKDLIFSMA